MLETISDECGRAIHSSRSDGFLYSIQLLVRNGKVRKKLPLARKRCLINARIIVLSILIYHHASTRSSFICRHFSNEDEIETLKKYLWVSTSKRQVNHGNFLLAVNISSTNPTSKTRSFLLISVSRD